MRSAYQIMPQSTLLLLVILIAVASAAGQGRIIVEEEWRPRPEPAPARGHPLQLKTLNVEAQITDGVAVTNVKQTFRNQTGRQIEGTYIFPLPMDAAVGEFSMTVNGQTLKGEVLEADKAREIYEQIVRRTRDPGLLEYLGQGMFRASLFPIPAGAEAEIRLRYTQTLPRQNDLVAFLHPLRACGAERTIEQLLIQIELKTQLPLTTVFSPSHECKITRPDDKRARVTLEQSKAKPERDFQLYYQPTEEAVGITWLTHRPAGEPGYFLLRLSPRLHLSASEIQEKDITFVIDTSGSMRGTKIEQVREALAFCIEGLNEGDRFNIFAFSTDVRPFREALAPANADLRAAAIEYAKGLEALGGTNIFQALTMALEMAPEDGERPYLIVLLTDGRPTVDVTDTATFLKKTEAANQRDAAVTSFSDTKQRARFHVLGVGTDVNTHLLDKLAELNRGSRDYCLEEEDLELKLSGLAARLSRPVMTNIDIQYVGADAFDIYPRPLPDLFHGSDLTILGRFRGSGTCAIAGSAVSAAGGILMEVLQPLPEKEAGPDFLPQLWAQRKVGYLLDQIRLHGEDKELVEEVVRLAKRHGIVTPYTAALALEDEAVAARPAPPIAGMGAPPRPQVRLRGAPRGMIARGGSGQPAESGEAAVRASQDLNRMQQGQSAEGQRDAHFGPGREVFRQIGGKTFRQDGERWVDTAWDGQKAPKRVEAFSDAYFHLLERSPALAQFFAVGPRVVVVWNGEVHEVTDGADEFR